MALSWAKSDQNNNRWSIRHDLNLWSFVKSKGKNMQTCWLQNWLAHEFWVKFETGGELIFSHFLSDSKRGCLSVRRKIQRKVRYTRFWMIRNWPKQWFLSIIAPAHSIYSPWPSVWLPLPIFILTLPTRKQLPNGCVPSIGKTKIFYITVEFDFLHLLWESVKFFGGRIDQKIFKDKLEHQKIFNLVTNFFKNRLMQIWDIVKHVTNVQFSPHFVLQKSSHEPHL